MFDDLSLVQKCAIDHLNNAIHFAKKLENTRIENELTALAEKLKTLRYSIAIIGHMNRGKSTLLNVLLGRDNDDISPVAGNVCTASIIKYIDLSASVDHDEEVALIYFEEGRTTTKVPFEEINQYITERENPANRKGVKMVEVYGNFPLLNELVILIDTPGKGTIYGHHDTLVREVLPIVDAIIQPIAGDLPLESDEVEFLKEISSLNKDKIFFVITKWDEVEEEDKKDVKDFIRDHINKIGFNSEKLYLTSARDVFLALTKNETENIDGLMEESGVKALESALENFIATKSKKNILYAQVKAYLDRIGGFGRSSIVQIDADLENCKCNLEALEEEERQLKEDGIKFKSECEKKSKAFIQLQLKSFTKFSRQMERKGDKIADRLMDKIERNKHLFDNIKMSFKLSESVSRECYMEAESLLFDLENELNQASKDFHKEIVSDFDLYLRKQKARDIVAPASSSMAAALVGGTGILGSTAILSAAASVPAAFSSFSTALVSWQGAASSVGAVQGAWAWFWGSSSTAATSSLLAAKSSVVASSMVLATSVVGSIATGGIAIAAFVAAKKMSTIGIQKLNLGKIQGIIDSTLMEMVVSLEEKTKKQYEYVQYDFKEFMEEVISKNEERLAQIKEEIQNADPLLEVRRIEEKQMALDLIERNEDLKTKMYALN